MRTRLLGVVVLCLAVSIAALAQTRDTPAATLGPRPTGTATLSGRVMRDTTPVARALVAIDAGDGRAERVTATNDDGQFSFSGLPAGRYLITATKHGWIATHYGSPRPGRPPGTRVAVGDGARVAITIPMVPGAVIAGRMIDTDGQPLAHLFPILLESRMVGDRRLIGRVNLPLDIGYFEKMTDDRGEFRLYGLPPGTYYLATMPPNRPSGVRVTTSAEVDWATIASTDPRATPPPQGPIAGDAWVYFPGTVNPSEAVPITLGAAEVREGLTIRVLNAQVSRVTGFARRSDGLQSCAQISLTEIDPKVALDTSLRGGANRDGAFTIAEVPPGEYRVTAKSSPCAMGAPAADADSVTGGPSQQGRPPEPPVVWGQTTIRVGGQDVDGVNILMEPAAMISGRLAFDGTTSKPPDDLSRVRLQFFPPEALNAAATGGSTIGLIQTATVSADGSFRVEGLAPDRYLVAASWPNMRGGDGTTGWWLTSVRAGDRDFGDGPIDVAAGANLSGVTITFKDRIGAVEGILTDAADKPASDFFVLAFPVERASWNAASRRIVAPARSGTDGHFRLNGLYAGEYYLAVVTGVGDGDATDPAFLDLLVPSAVRVTVGDGEVKRQDLKIAR